jgi:predicted Zn-dependent peptidase
MTAATHSATVHLGTLPNGVRTLLVPMPWRDTVSLSVFVRAGSLHESRLTNGISHVVEHMAFKGTGTRDNHRINFDAERLGGEFTAHTDRDHTAFHIEGLPGDLPAFVAQVADIVRDSRFPADELERERAVIAHEFTEIEDDAVTLAFQCFDRAAWGEHPAAWPVIGRRANLARFTRDDLMAHVQRLYTGCNLVVAAAGPLPPDALAAPSARAFGTLPAGTPNTVPLPRWQGGSKLRRVGGSTQCHVVLGWQAPPLPDPAHAAWQLAAAVLGEGMSSPLLARLREQRGLAYHLGASADIGPASAELVVDGSVEPAQAAELLSEVQAMVAALAQAVPADDLERARNQLRVRVLRDAASPARRLEQAVQDLFTLGSVREPTALAAALHAVPAEAVRAVFATLLQAPAALGLSGSVPAGLREKAATLFRL